MSEQPLIPTESPPVPSAITRPPATTAPRARVQLDAEAEQEIEAAVAELTQALEDSPRSQFGGRTKPQTKSPSGARRGRVISVSGDNIFVDMGGKSEGVISAMQFPEGPPAVGSEVELIIDHYDAAEGLLILRRPGAAQEADWSTIKEGMVVEGRVTAAGKSGLVLELSGIRAFMPASLIDIVRVEDLDSYVGQTLRCQVSEVKRSEKNVILSRRALLEAEREAAREKTWAELAEGQTRTGTVRNVKDFGAFLDLGGIDGLLPVREMSWTPVKDASEVVRIGQQVQVKVLRIDRETRKITLGLKQLQTSPWETIEQRMPIGGTVTGRVTKLMDFGAFVELEPGIEGLVHISELAHQRVRRVRDVVQEDQMLAVQILKIDAEQRRIALSHKATIEKAAPEPEPAEHEADEPPPPPKPPRKTPLKGGLGR